MLRENWIHERSWEVGGMLGDNGRRETIWGLGPGRGGGTEAEKSNMTLGLA